MISAGVLATGCMLLAGSAAADEGPVTVWFEGTAGELTDRLGNLCADRNAAVVEQDERHLLCQREMSGGKGILAQALLGNSSSTTPILNVRFSILKDRKALRVQAVQWVELQMAGGQVRRTNLDSRKQRMELENTLIGAGGHNVYPGDLGEQPAPGEGEAPKDNTVSQP